MLAQATHAQLTRAVRTAPLPPWATRLVESVLAMTAFLEMARQAAPTRTNVALLIIVPQKLHAPTPLAALTVNVTRDSLVMVWFVPLVHVARASTKTIVGVAGTVLKGAPNAQAETRAPCVRAIMGLSLPGEGTLVERIAGTRAGVGALFSRVVPPV